MASSIRPVTARWPSSASLWEETSLPLACVLQPCAKLTSSRSLHSLSAIPKCLHCGAPQQDATHLAVHGGTSLLCHLCGKVTSRIYKNQVSARPSEQLSQETYTRRGVPDSVFALPLHDNVYSLPAMACPPIWWIVVDGTCQEQQYWNTVGNCLNHVCDDMPSYIHVGLLVSTPTSLAVWDLSSAVPHVQHLEWNETTFTNLSCSPNKSNLQAALRALGDSTTTANNKRHTTNTTGMPLGDTLQVILQTMTSDNSHPGNTSSGSSTTPTYAGGKITCILSGAPVECKSILRKQQQESQPHANVGTGGLGGSCAVLGQRYTFTEDAVSNGTTAYMSSDDVELGGSNAGTKSLEQEDDPTDMTATNLAKLYKYDKTHHPELYYSELGAECGRAGFGVDVLVLQSGSNSFQEEHVGIPFLRQLSDRSGAPGPLLVSNETDFQSQLASKTPWASCKQSLVFGGTLRVRTSPGFHVDDSHVEGSHGDGPQLAPLYSSGGLMGPATAVESSLWNMGSCDQYTAVTIDLQVNRNVKDRVYVDGMGDVAIKHSIQTCFAYTAIEKDENGEFVTVRRLAIASLHLPLAHDTESLYATLDPEALAVMLFHKLTIASLQDGLVAAHDIGQEWLTSLLSCVYRSALEEEELQKEQLSRGLDNMNPVFYPQERLVNHGGDLSVQDILLGHGHERLNTVALIVFALLQCDALRPCMGTYRPSVDARSAASAQMYSMIPSVLARCIAPRMELWSSNTDDEEPIVEDLDLSIEHVGLSIMEHRQTARDPSSDLILFVDTPREILVVDSRHLQPNSSDGCTTTELEIGRGLERCIKIAAKSYRVAPPIVFAMDVSSSSQPLSRIQDVLVEDSRTIQGLENFEQWKQEVAAMVQEGLDLS